MEIMQGVYRLQLPIPNNPLGYLNVYLLKGDDGYIMFDTGWPTEETLGLLIEKLGEIKLSIQDISLIVISHGHPDHLGLAGTIRELYGTQIMMHELEALSTHPDRWYMDDVIWNWLLDNGMPDDAVSVLSQRKWGEHEYTWRIEPDIMVKGGEVIPLGSSFLEVIWTPGHSRGHICLYEPQRKILLSGDHVLPVITPNISFYPRSAVNPLGNYINSLKRIATFEVDMVLPGHQNIFTNLSERAGQIISHHEQRSEELLQVLTSGKKTAHDILSNMQWVGINEVVVLGENLQSAQQMGALAETMAHLELLRLEGMVEQVSNSGKTLFYTHIREPRVRFS